MRRAASSLALALALACGVAPDPRPGDPVELTADELHRAFLDDAAAARERYGPALLVVSGEVAQAEPRFRGTTMRGEVEVDPWIAFHTGLDTLPTGVWALVAEGSFDDPDPDRPFAVDPRVRAGETVRVECPGADLRWRDPELRLADCRLAF